VDASDLHLILSPTVRERHDFLSGHEAIILQELCVGCGACLAHCRFKAVRLLETKEAWAALDGGGAKCEECDYCRRSCSARVNAQMREMRDAMGEDQRAVFLVDSLSCEGCGVCAQFCPVSAIEMVERHCGEWMVSDTRHGIMVHARLHPGGENSGKLVTTVRKEARRLAEENGRSLILVDGPPGVGCPVIASLGGASMALVVAEPTVSGEHDIERALSLARHFQIPSAVCVNKWDINPEMTERVEAKARAMGARVLGRARYDPQVTRAQMEGRAVVETDAPSAADIRAIWEDLMKEEKN
jgi:MinD superfamily P-loop ATPase